VVVTLPIVVVVLSSCARSPPPRRSWNDPEDDDVVVVIAAAAAALLFLTWTTMPFAFLFERMGRINPRRIEKFGETKRMISVVIYDILVVASSCY
jgi:hypothetical protein